MKLTTQLYKENYFNKNRYVDYYNRCINLFPFNTNGTSGHFKKKYPFESVLGHFFRLISDDKSSAISSWELCAKEPVQNYLKKKNLDSKTYNLLEEILEDILFSNGSLNVVNKSFYKYISTEGDPIAEYLFSLLQSKVDFTKKIEEKDNVFSSIVNGVFCDETGSDTKLTKSYDALNFVKDMFTQDLFWFWKHEDVIVKKYLASLSYFYTCYSLYQSIARLSLDRSLSNQYENKPFPLYYLIFGEVASGKRSAVVSGWNGIISPVIDYLYADHQTLDLMNCLMGYDEGRQYSDFDVDFDQELSTSNREICLEVIESYRTKKWIDSEEDKNTEFYSNLNLSKITTLKDVYVELNALCRKNERSEYLTRMRNMINELFQYNLLQNRRGNKVLVLNEEMLIFILALVTKEKRCLLDEMYKNLTKYGILFDKSSKEAIENYLFKLNLLDRKSDSGDAQYVKIIL